MCLKFILFLYFSSKINERKIFLSQVEIFFFIFLEKKNIKMMMLFLNDFFIFLFLIVFHLIYFFQAHTTRWKSCKNVGKIRGRKKNDWVANKFYILTDVHLSHLASVRNYCFTTNNLKVNLHLLPTTTARMRTNKKHTVEIRVALLSAKIAHVVIKSSQKLDKRRYFVRKN